MSNYDFKAIEYEKILQKILKHIINENSTELVKNLSYTKDFITSETRLNETESAYLLILEKYDIPITNFKNPTVAIEKAKKGAILSGKSLLNISKILKTSKEILNYCKNTSCTLNRYFSKILDNNFVENSIDKTFLSENEINDNASHELSRIRRKIRDEEYRLRQLFAKTINQNSSKYLQESLVTIRNGRCVIPVRSECKSEVAGIVHDISKTGSTLFIEPLFALEKNNAIEELRSKERNEIEKILKELTLIVLQIDKQILENYRNIIKLDIIFAKAKYSKEIKGIRPRLNTEYKLNIINARNPLIDDKKVVPISLNLGINFKAIVISGPNAGGKTVCLKTVGLLCYMTNIGLFVPADDGTEIPIYDRIFVDIGDEQSISNDLSTFSSHMKKLVHTVKSATKKSLILIDEIGGGTDPREGVSIAAAVLDYLIKKETSIIVTSHYSELKVYATNTDNIENASFKFDKERMVSTHRLVLGTPGRSYAYAISKILGLPEEILKNAKTRIEIGSERFENAIERIETIKENIEREEKTIKKLRKKVEEDLKEIESKNLENNTHLKKLKQNAEHESMALIRKAKNEADEALKEIREQKEKQEKKEIENRIEQVRFNLSNKLKLLTKENKSKGTKYEFSILDNVKIIDTGATGVITKIFQNNRAKIEVNGIPLLTKISNLEIISNIENIPKKTKEKKVHITISNKQKASLKIDLRGQYVEDALLNLETFVDQAIRSNLKALTIIHGKGTGKLKRAVCEFLSQYNFLTFRQGEYGEGDLGVTIVELK